ncbi:MAG: PAS domain S-box protein [Ignavibacteria bacterium]
MSTDNYDHSQSHSISDLMRTFLKNKTTLQPERKRIWLALFLLTGGLLLTLTACLLLKTDVEQNAKNEFDFACTGFNDKIMARLYTHVQLVRSGAAFFENSETVTHIGWQNFAASQKMQMNSAGIYGTGYAEIIPQDQSALHEEKTQGKGLPQYSVKPDGKREIHTRVTYIEPFSGENLHVFGYDVFSNPVCRKALEKSGDYNIVALSGRIPPVRGNNKHIQADAFMCAPVYRRGMPTGNFKECRRAIRGWVFITYRINDLINEIFEGSKEKDILSPSTFASRPSLIKRNLLLEISDNFVFDRKALLFDGREAIKNKEKSSPLFSLKYSILVNNAQWYSQFTQYDSEESSPDYSKVWYAATGGTGISILLFVVYLLLINTNIRAYKLAEELTRDLSESEAKYRTIFNNEIYAVCVFDSETFKFLDVNQAHCSMYGYSKDEFLSGMTIHNVTDEPRLSVSYISRAVNQETVFIPLRYHKKKDGTVFPCEIVAGSYMRKGRSVMFALVHDITERRRAEEALRESEARHSSMIANISDVLCITGADGMLKYNSPNVEKWFGWQPQELLGMDGRLNIHPDDFEYVQKEFFSLLEKDNSVRTVEYRVRCKDGSYKQVHLTAVNLINDPVINGVLTNYHDISKRKKSEAALCLRESYLSAIIENLPGLLWLKDLESKILFANSKLLNATGLDKQESLTGTTDFDLVPKELADKYVAEDLIVIETQKTIIVEEQISDKGNIKWFETYKAPVIDIQGRVIGTTGYAIDITERKFAELELLRLNENLQISKIHAEENLIQEHSLVKELTMTKEKLEVLNSEKNKLLSIIANDLKGVDTKLPS